MIAGTGTFLLPGTAATASGFCTTAGSNEMYILHARVEDLYSNNQYIRIHGDDNDSTAILGGVMTILTGARDEARRERTLPTSHRGEYGWGWLRLPPAIFQGGFLSRVCIGSTQPGRCPRVLTACTLSLGWLERRHTSAWLSRRTLWRRHATTLLRICWLVTLPTSS